MIGMAPNTLCPLPSGRNEEELGEGFKVASPPAIVAAAAGAAVETVTTNGSAPKAVCMGAGAGCAALLVFFFLLVGSGLAPSDGVEPMVKDSTPPAQQQPVFNAVCIDNNEYTNTIVRLPISKE